MAQGNESMDVSEMIGRVLGFVGITYGGNLTKRLLNEIVRRFKS
jgi:ATP-dependent Clp protease ATP-binding subunit ClpA